MKIKAGLLKTTAMWEELLTQEGVPFAMIKSGDAPTIEEYSVVIINRRMTSDENAGVSDYLRHGGAILARADYTEGLGGMNARENNIEYVFGDRIFPIDLTDIGSEGFVCSEANCLRTEENAPSAFAGVFCGGYSFLLPFDIAELTEDCRAGEKTFYAHRERLPSERVSVVSKGNVRLLLHYGLEHLHHVRNIPYAHLSYHPDDQSTVFAFRIDSDGASPEEVTELYSLGREFAIPMSWYLDVKSHEQWLTRFVEMEGQEIGVHCYEHRTFHESEQIKKNVEHAVSLLEEIGIRRSGFSAPYGVWSPALAQALDELGFEYSSEFSYAYDTLPLRPSFQGKRFETLQIPIHPICIGSLLRVGYSSLDQKRYFASIVRWKRQRAEPLLFYHHPSHKKLDVVRDLFETMRNGNVRCISFGEYAAWWKRRSLVRMSIEVMDGNIEVQSMDAPPEDLRLRVTRENKTEALAPLTGTLPLQSLQWTPMPSAPALPSDFRRITEFDLRQSIGKLFTRLQRDFR